MKCGTSRTLPRRRNAKPSDEEIELGATLIENLSDEFKPDKYRDEYRERVQAMLDEKSKGQEITIAAPEAPRHAQIIDLMQALKQSIEKAKPKEKAVPAEDGFVRFVTPSFICSACAVDLSNLD
jgi:non-homologous end joining protein Ku